MPRRRIPVVLIAGFLGSGKTTLLNHLLRNNSGVRIGVVVNDFGSVNIDSMLVAGQVDSVVSLANGCVCCAVNTDDLDGLLDKLAHRNSRVDVIVVEASGLAEPRSLIRLVRGSGNDYIEYGGLVTVVDAAELDSTRARHPEVDNHIRMADLVILNKVDRIPAEQRDAVRTVVRGIAPQTPIVVTTHGRVAVELLFDSPDRQDADMSSRQMTLDELLSTTDDGESEHQHLHDTYSSAHVTTDLRVAPREFVDFLENPPGNIYRIKGIVHFGIPGYRQKFVVHTVGRHITFAAQPWAPGEPRVTTLVFIGTAVDQTSVDDAFSSVVVRDDSSTDVSAMLSVHRYWTTSQPTPTHRR